VLGHVDEPSVRSAAAAVKFFIAISVEADTSKRATVGGDGRTQMLNIPSEHPPSSIGSIAQLLQQPAVAAAVPD